MIAMLSENWLCRVVHGFGGVAKMCTSPCEQFEMNRVLCKLGCVLAQKWDTATCSLWLSITSYISSTERFAVYS